MTTTTTTTTTESEAHYALPDVALMHEIGELPILDESGSSLPFKSLWTGDNATTRHLIIFIRHFYCGLCEAYVQELTHHLSQKFLDTLTPPVRLSIVGCGQLAPVADYKQRTGCGFPIYCDSDRNIYAKLGMVVNLGMGGKKPEYLKASAFSTTINSAWNAFTAGRNSLRAGNYSQNGGELLIQDGKAIWCHRMKNTRDHAEISELKTVLKI